MGQELLENNAIARDTVNRLDRALDEIEPTRTWTLYEKLLRAENYSNLGKAEYPQPCCTAPQIVLVGVLKSLNIHPFAVNAHCYGESLLHMLLALSPPQILSPWRITAG